MPEYHTIVLRSDLAKTLLESGRHVLEREVLLPYLAKRRWFAAKDETLEAARLAYLDRLPGEQPLFISEIETTTSSGTARWLIPLALVWEGEPASALPSQLALAHVARRLAVIMFAMLKHGAEFEPV